MLFGNGAKSECKTDSLMENSDDSAYKTDSSLDDGGESECETDSLLGNNEESVFGTDRLVTRDERRVGHDG